MVNSLVNRKENKQINFRVTDEEFKRLSKMAKDIGLSVPAFCKLKSKGIKTKTPKINNEIGHEIAIELRKIGCNLNEIIKNINNTTYLENEIKTIQEDLKNIWQLLN